MTTEQAVKIIKEMLFGKAEVKMAEARLMDGTTLTNNLECDFEIGQTLYVVDADGTLVLAPAAQEHQLEDGTIVVLDEASIIVEIRAAGAEEVEEAEETTEINFEDELNNIKLSIEKLLDVIEKQSKDFSELKSDYDAFKQSEDKKPINTKKE